MVNTINREQLKDIINEAYTDILNELKNKENYIDKLALQRVMHALIKKGVLSEQLGTENFMSRLMPGSSERKMRRSIQQAEEGELPQPGESWEAARERTLQRPEPRAGGNEDVWKPYSMQGPTSPDNWDAGVEWNEEEAPGLPAGGPEEGGPVPVQTGPSSGMPTHFHTELSKIVQAAPSGFRNNIDDVGNEVFNHLSKSLGGIKTQEQMGELVLQIVDTVVDAMGTATGRKWAKDVTENPLASEAEAIAGAPAALAQFVAEALKRM